MTYTLTPLPYSYNALQPYISEQTVRIHHSQYHLAYVERVNPVLVGTRWEDVPIESVLRELSTIPDDKRIAVRNYGGGFYNHNLYFGALSPNAGGEPTGELKKMINNVFGSFERFQDAFFQKGGRELFGAGWAWLVYDHGNLDVVLTPNQENPISQNRIPILGIDVWEHAYYPQYLSRKDYFNAWWHLVDWTIVEKRLQSARENAAK